MKDIEWTGSGRGVRAGMTAIVAGALCIGACSSESGTGASGTGGTGAPACARTSAQPDFTSEHLDYGNAALWLCAPGCANDACATNVDATEYLKDGSTRVVRHVAATSPAFDCFYVYPTVALEGTGNVTDLANVTPMKDPLLSQGAQFTSLCRVYAPLYRQATINSIQDAAVFGRAYADVKEAFEHYLAYDNQGRDFVLLGHSQGSMHLQRLIAETVDVDATLRARMISALLIGDPLLTVPEGQLVGGSFQNVPVCSRASERGCVVAYSSYAKEAPASETSPFGHPPAGMTGMQTACTSPSALLGRSETLGAYLAVHVTSKTFAADTPPGTLDAATPFAIFRDMFHAGDCVERGGAHVLEVSASAGPGDKRGVPPYRESSVEAVGFGMHIVDYNIALDDLLAIVAAQAAAPR